MTVRYRLAGFTCRGCGHAWRPRSEKGWRRPTCPACGTRVPGAVAHPARSVAGRRSTLGRHRDPVSGRWLTENGDEPRAPARGDRTDLTGVTLDQWVDKQLDALAALSGMMLVTFDVIDDPRILAATNALLRLAAAVEVMAPATDDDAIQRELAAVLDAVQVRVSRNGATVGDILQRGSAAVRP